MNDVESEFFRKADPKIRAREEEAARLRQVAEINKARADEKAREDENRRKERERLGAEQERRDMEQRLRNIEKDKDIRLNLVSLRTNICSLTSMAIFWSIMIWVYSAFLLVKAFGDGALVGFCVISIVALLASYSMAKDRNRR